MDAEGPDERFNETIHAPLRLRTCGLLRSVDKIDFPALRDTLGISDASLSKHLRVLSENGFVKVTKIASPTRNDARRVTWVKLTAAGRKAFDAHLEVLRIIAGGDPTSGPRRSAEVVGE